MFEDGLRSEGHSEAARRALADVGRTQVVHPRRRSVKLKNKGFKGVILPKDDDITSLPPRFTNGEGANELVKVTVELPAGMVAAAGGVGPGSRINQLVWQGLRDQLGNSWYGPRFLKRVEAKAMKRADARSKFTL